MSTLRDTYSFEGAVTHKLGSVAALLRISENTLRNNLAECGIEIDRMSSENPAAPSVRIFTLRKIFEIAKWRKDVKNTNKPKKKPIVIAFSLVKGGVGKSTSTAEMGIQLQLRGNNVLIIDLDQQSNVSHLLGYESDIDPEELKEFGLSEKALIRETFLDFLGPFIDKLKNRNKKTLGLGEFAIKKPFGDSGPSLIPADANLEDLTSALNDAPGDKDHMFRLFFQESMNGNVPELDISDFDFVLMDCAPGDNVVTANAIAAADYVISPVRMDFFGAKGVTRLVDKINELKSRSDKVKAELVILPTFYSDNVGRTARMLSRLNIYTNNIVGVTIPQSEKFPVSSEKYLPLTLQYPKCDPVLAYQSFVDAFLDKLKA